MVALFQTGKSGVLRIPFPFPLLTLNKQIGNKPALWTEGVKFFC